MEHEKGIAVAIRNLANQFHRYMATVIVGSVEEAEGIARMTDIQGRIISYLYESRAGEAVYQRDIEKQFNIRRSTATSILKRIERNGFIRRETSVGDARMKTLILTDKALRLCPRARAEILKAERQAAKGLSDAELALFFRTVEIIGRNIGKDIR